MEWFKVALDYIAALQWWQILLGFLTITILGILIGICVVYLLQRYVYKERLPFKSVLFYLVLGRVPSKIVPIIRIPSPDRILKRAPKAKAIVQKYKSSLNNITPRLIRKGKVVTTVIKPAIINKISSISPQVEIATPSHITNTSQSIMGNVQQTQNQANFIKPKLLIELLHNQNIASESSTGTLAPFQTEVWDAQQFTANDLPNNLQNDLERLYTDIKIWNNLVWLATELGHQSHSLREEHKKLLSGLATRIDEAIKKYGTNE